MGRRSLKTIVQRYDVGDHITDAEMFHLYVHVSNLEITLASAGVSGRTRRGFIDMSSRLATYLVSRKVNFEEDSRESRFERTPLFDRLVAGQASEADKEVLAELLEMALETLEALGDAVGLADFLIGLQEQVKPELMMQPR